MSADKKLTLTFRWEGRDRDNRYTVDERQLEVDSLPDAVKLGVSYLALHFRDAAAPNGPRQFTNVFGISDAKGFAEKMEAYSTIKIDPATISRMFSRVSENPEEQKKYDAIRTLDDAIAALKAEPPETVFVTPSNGGIIKLEEGDTAFGPKGEKVWPPEKRPAPGFTLTIR